MKFAKQTNVTVQTSADEIELAVNPADSASRGISVKKLMRSWMWLTGPDFSVQ